jgi:hypothetical protein
MSTLTNFRYAHDSNISASQIQKLSYYHDNNFGYFMFGKYNGFVSKARVSACMYFLVVTIIPEPTARSGR